MKEKVFTLRLSICITFISLGLAIFVNFILEKSDITYFLYDIMIGLFGGAILSVLIYITEYRTSKRYYLENYYIKTIELLDKIISVKYLYFSTENRLLIDYMLECKSNDWLNSNNNENKYSLIEYYKFPKELQDQQDIFLDEKTKIFKQKLDEVLQSYIRLSDFKYREIEDEFRGLYFFLNQKKRKLIYENIHDNLRSTLNHIKEETIHFKLYIDGEGNMFAVCKILEELQNSLFRIEEKHSNNLRSTIIYRRYSNDMEQTLENFRAKIYNQKSREVSEQIAVSYTNTEEL